jgi:hypothetical protein
MRATEIGADCINGLAIPCHVVLVVPSSIGQGAETQQSEVGRGTEMVTSAFEPVGMMRWHRSVAVLLLVATLLAVALPATAGPAAPDDKPDGVRPSLVLQDEPEPTATKRPTRTPKPYNEMEGMPTIPSASDGSPTAVRSPTVRPTATFAPTLLEDGTVAAVIGTEGGSLTSPGGVTVNIPAGALTAPSTITIQPLSDSKVPATNGVEVVRGTAFDVTVAGADGRAIEQLSEPVEVRVQLDEDVIEDGARLYQANGGALSAMPNVRIEGNELVVTVTTVTRMVAGRSVTVTATGQRNVLPFILAAIVVIFAMIVMIVLAGMFRPRRQRIITNRRPTRTRHR